MVDQLVVPNGGFFIVHWLIGGERAINVFGLNIAAGTQVNQAVADALAVQTQSWFSAAGLAPLVHTSDQIQSVGIRDLRSANLPEYVANVTGAGGSDATEPLPNNIAIVVTLRTALAGKSFRGRSYVPLNGGTAWDGTTMHYTPAAVTAAGAWLTQIRTGLPLIVGTSGGLHLAVVSRGRKKDNGDPPTVPAQSNVVISSQVRSNIQGSQRGRIAHRG
jgi:hypothetical protein